MISAVALARALYSASILNLETVACFCALHETKLGPIKTAKPPVERLSSKQPAQSTPENALTSKEIDLLILSPSFLVYLRYLSILLTAAQ